MGRTGMDDPFGVDRGVGANVGVGAGAGAGVGAGVGATAAAHQPPAHTAHDDVTLWPPPPAVQSDVALQRGGCIPAAQPTTRQRSTDRVPLALEGDGTQRSQPAAALAQSMSAEQGRSLLQFRAGAGTAAVRAALRHGDARGAPF
jgi:hypothetical protein